LVSQYSDYRIARKYWCKLKERLDKEGSQLVTNCYQLKMTAEDGKQRFTDGAVTVLFGITHITANDLK
jgi:hypothetical protein